MEKKQKVVLSVIGIATLLVALLGATFAWFSVQTSGSVDATTELETANLGTVTFANGNTAEAIGSEIYPGWNNEAITFSVIGANTTEPIEYTVTATVTGSTKLAGALTYSMACTTSNSGTCASAVSSAPLATTTYTGTLATGNDTHTYTVNMSLPETNINQNEYQGLNYKVEFSVVLTNPATKYTHSGSAGSRTNYITPETCFTTSDVDGGVKITAYDNTKEGCTLDVVIPSQINGKSVVSIGTSAFLQKNITSVVIPNSVTSIGTNAFASNKLTTLVIPNSVITIGNTVFLSNKLTSITIPNSVTSIGLGTFNDNQLSDSQAFIYARKADGSEDKTTLISYGGAKKSNVIIPDGVKTIDGAFLSANITSVTIPNSVTTIGEQAFRNNQLTSITIPTSITSIGSNAFNKNLLPDEQAFIYARKADGSEDKTTLVSYGGAKRSNVVIPEGVITISERAFISNQLMSVTIPASVKNIGSNAFSGNSLTNVCIKGKANSSAFTSYPASSPFKWASGYSDANITWNCTD